MPPPICDSWFLTGPTASGKTSVGLELAQQIDAEIVSLDSMAIYRHMDIGTAKPTVAQREVVPHHLIDIVDPTETFSLSAYIQAASAKITEIQSRGKQVLFVGGTPLYLKGMLRGIFQGPPADWEFRQNIEQELRRVGAGALHDRLKLLDPLSAARLHPNDVRRVVRALEVYRMTGQPISHLQLQFDEAADRNACRVFVLDWPRDQLDHRIEGRVERMFQQGFVDEVRQLLARYTRLSRTASQAVGYREAIDLLAGNSSEQEAIRRIKARTRQFAKRQLTWFRSLSECRPIPCRDDAVPADIVRQILLARL